MKFQYKKDLQLVEYLTTPTQMLSWKQFNLPQDEICLENQVIFSKHNRPPLVIDSSGFMVEFFK